MISKGKEKIVVDVSINKSNEKVWELWTSPEHIINWYFASDDWHAPRAENDLKIGGKFSISMEAKDGSMGFDFSGTYTKLNKNKLLVYQLDDGRDVRIEFKGDDGKTTIRQIFEAEETHTIDQQKSGWQAILINFKKYAEMH